jgi:hypothetical protein
MNHPRTPRVSGLRRTLPPLLSVPEGKRVMNFVAPDGNSMGQLAVDRTTRLLDVYRLASFFFYM